MAQAQAGPKRRRLPSDWQGGRVRTGGGVVNNRDEWCGEQRAVGGRADCEGGLAADCEGGLAADCEGRLAADCEGGLAADCAGHAPHLVRETPLQAKADVLPCHRQQLAATGAFQRARLLVELLLTAAPRGGYSHGRRG